MTGFLTLYCYNKNKIIILNVINRYNTIYNIHNNNNNDNNKSNIIIANNR